MKQIIKKEEYLEKIIHDLKTPATAQICALESLLKATDSKFSKKELDLIELTLNSCNYMKNLIDTFLNVLKLNSQKLSLNYTKFNFNELVKEVISEVNILLKYNELLLEITSDNEIILHADRLQIKRVIENILSNSIKNAYKNTTIQINISKIGAEVCFEVQNNSPYIEPEILKEIFNKYKTHCSFYNKPSIGLGLYLSKEIINAHFGRMIAKSFADDINIFGFYLPER